MHSLIIFASGAGSNAQAIINHFKTSNIAKVSLIVCNKPDAGVLQIAKNEGIDSLVVDKTTFNQADFMDTLNSHNPTLLILAGFLWKIPTNIVAAFTNRIINIHPALLPKYGGKGMYGHHVHNAVITAQEKESGITIHYVDEVYDNGNKILQAHCSVLPSDTPQQLATRIHKLEHFFYPRTIAFLLTNN